MNPDQFKLVEEIFASACELPPEDREPFIEERCAGDGLVYKEVIAFLDADDDAEMAKGGDLSGMGWPGEGDVTQIDAAAADAVEQSIPERIGRYRILRECGRGGMGVVYEAEQERPSRRVALKVVRTGVVSPELLRRFHNEAEVLGRLQHPGIAQIFEAGSFEVGDGVQPFFAMEFVDGPELREYAAAQALDTKARLALFTRVCDAVHYAHEQGVIHRDLKPENILVVCPTRATPAPGLPTTQPGAATTGYGAEGIGQPKVLDFGVARMTDADIAMTTMHTAAGQIIGTIQYMSPEQAAGDSRELDARSDVYTLGVVLYEFLAGCLPYDLRNRSIPDSIRALQEEEPNRLSSVNHLFRGDLDTIVGKCLEKDPDRRYATAAELAEDIGRHLRDEPITARQPSSWYQIRKFTRRNRALVGGVLATVVALVLGLVFTTMFAFRANKLSEATQRQAYAARMAAAAAFIDTSPNLARPQLEGAPEALRGWEWRHLHSRLERSVRGYEADVPSTGPIAYIRGGAQLVSALVDGRVAVWDAESAELVRVGTGLAGSSITALAATSDGPPLIACGTQDGRVRIWDLDADPGSADKWLDADPGDIGRMPEDWGWAVSDEITGMVWDRSGERLLYSTQPGVHLWRRGHAVRDHRIEWGRGDTRPGGLAFNADGSWYSASTATLNGGESFWWETGTGERISTSLRAFEAQDGRKAWAYVSPDGSWVPIGRHTRSHDGTRLAVPGGDGPRSCVLMGAQSPDVQLVLRGHNDSVVHSLWTPDDTRLVTSSDDGTIRLWDTTTGASLAAVDADRASPIAVTPDDSGVVFRAEGTLRSWDFSPASTAVLRPDVSYVYFLAYSEDGTRLAAASIFSIPTVESPYTVNTTVMDPLIGRVVRTIDVLTGWPPILPGEPFITGRNPTGLAFSPDGRRLDVGTATIDVATGEVVPRQPDEWIAERSRADLWCARFTPGTVRSDDGALLATSIGSHHAARVVVDDIATGETALTLEGGVWGVAFSPDGTLLAAACENPGRVQIWSLAEKRKLVEFPAHGSIAMCVDFHPDGTRLASGGNDNAVTLWDTTTWEPVLELRGHESYVKSLVFSPDGTQLASGSGDLSVRIWDTVTRAERHRQAMDARGR